MNLLIFYKIIYIIFDFSLVLLTLSSLLNRLLIVYAQCYPLLLLSSKNFFCCILPFQPYPFSVLKTFVILLGDENNMLFDNYFNVI